MVVPGNALRNLATTAPMDFMHAHSVERQTTMCKNVALSDPILKVITPLWPEIWEQEFKNHGIFNKHVHTIASLSDGFDMGVTSEPTTSYTPSNHRSACDKPEVIKVHIMKELTARRYSRRFTQTELEGRIGFFRSSPLGVIEKAGAPGEFRVVQDLSYPRNDSQHKSVNAEINTENFKCDWGTFSDIANIVLDAPPHSRAATLDVDTAYRQCPIAPEQQKHFVVQWRGKFYIDHCMPFGASSASGNFGSLADAKTDILWAKQFSLVANWADDFFFLQRPSYFEPDGTPIFTYNLQDLYNLGDKLGWPWKQSKIQPFSESFRYLGFDWDIPTQVVTLAKEKREKYKRKIIAWLKEKAVDEKSAQSLLGTLTHCTHVIPLGWSRLPKLASFTASFIHLSSTFIKLTIPRGVTADVMWWKQTLDTADCSTKLARPPPIYSKPIFVDTSSGWEVGVVTDGEWYAWKFKEGWKRDRRDIGWAEMVAVELGLRVIIHKGLSHQHVLMQSDNQGVIQALSAGKS